MYTLFDFQFLFIVHLAYHDRGLITLDQDKEKYIDRLFVFVEEVQEKEPIWLMQSNKANGYEGDVSRWKLKNCENK